MKQTYLRDSVALRDVQTHKDGYRIVRGRVARTGLQGYRRWELGDAAPMGDPNDVLNIYRPDDEVFAGSAVNGWAHVPVTLDHPAELVTPDNVKDLAVGEVTSRARIDGEWFELEWMVKDQAGIEALDTTHFEVSGGYTADIDYTPGVTDDGRSYDGVQRSIDPNHLALVPRGRAFGDAAATVANWGNSPQLNKDHEMSMKPIAIGDAVVNVAIADADVIVKMIKDHKAEVEAKDAEIEARDTKIGELKAENAETAKKVMGDADIAAEVIKRKLVTDKAAEFVKEFKDDGQSLADIKRAAVKSHFGDEAASTDVTDAEINGIFRVMEPVKVDDKARDAMKQGKEKSEGKGSWDFAIKKKGDK